MNWTNVRAKIGALVAIAFILLMVAAFATGPASERPGLLFIVGVIVVLVALAVWFLKRGFSNLVLLIAGGVPREGLHWHEYLLNWALQPLAGVTRFRRVSSRRLLGR